MRIKRSYEIKRIDEPREVVERTYNRKTKRVEDQRRTINGGFLVAFPQGHSTFFETEEQMLAAGISPNASLVDMDTGMPVSPELAASFGMSLHAMVEGNTRMSNTHRRAHSIDVANTGDE